MKFTEIEEKLDNKPELTLLIDKPDIPLKAFLVQFFTYYNNKCKTLLEEDGTIQCDTGKRRSIDDIYRICKQYYDCSLEDVTKILINELPKILNGFRTSYCTTINKRVFYFDENKRSAVYNKGKQDQFGKVWSDWCKFINKEEKKGWYKVDNIEQQQRAYRRRMRQRMREIQEEAQADLDDNAVVGVYGGGAHAVDDNGDGLVQYIQRNTNAIFGEE